MNLLTKLSEKFKNMSAETKKRIAATMLAGSMAFSGLGMTGCTNTNNTTNNNGSSIQTPGGDNSGNNSGNQNSSNGGTQTPDYSKYSQILQNVLTDFYYYELISLNNSYYETTKENLYWQNAKYNAIPYGFLEEEGFDINKIKKNEVESYSDMFLDGNNLIIELKIENKVGYEFSEGVSSYFTNYILKYELTDQEIKEIKALFTQLTSGEKETYFQSAFFVQELSYLKTPTVVSKAYATEKGLQTFEKHSDKENYFETNSIEATYMGVENLYGGDIYFANTFQIHPTMVSRYDKSQGTMTVAQITVYSTGSGCASFDGLKIYNSSKPDAHFTNDEYLQNFENSKRSVTFLSCQNSYFRDVKAKESTLEDLLSN